MDHVFCVLLKMSSPNPRSPRFSPKLSSKMFIVLHLAFRSMIHFELVIVKGIKSGSIFFICGCPVIPAHLSKQTVLSPLNCPCSFMKNVLTVFVWFFM